MPLPITHLFEDPKALFVVLVLLLLQLFAWRRWSRATRAPLRQQADALRGTTKAVDTANEPGVLTLAAAPEVAQALRAAYPAGTHEEALDPRAAFASECLLPMRYNARLDAAAPGIFTALGIIGTFLGLILAFAWLDFSDAARSIQPLLAGMTVAFVNSLVGVGASIAWTLRSRFARHDFDVASHELLARLEARFPRPAYGTHLLGALVALRDDARATGEQLRAAVSRVAQETQTASTAQREASERLEVELRGLREATQGASRDLLDSLAPRLEESFRSLVDLPFDRLGESVERFRTIVDETADRSERTLAALDASVGALGTAQWGLEQAATTASACVSEFASGVHALQEGASAATAVAGESRRAAEVLQGTVTTLSEAGERHGQLAAALDGAVVELRGTAGALDGAAAQFIVGAERMAAAAGHIEHLGTEAAESSLRAVRTELEATVVSMAAALSEFGDRNVAAYDSSSARIVEALDARVSDLTDRLSAELQTLATRLPESAAEITRAATQLRKQLAAAVSGLEQSVRSLDTGTTQTLAARLAEYDGLVAQAVDRFSGTLLTWDGKITELGAAGQELRSGMADAQREVSATLAGARGSAEAAARAAEESSRAAVAVQAAAAQLSDAQVRALMSPLTRTPTAGDHTTIAPGAPTETLS